MKNVRLNITFVDLLYAAAIGASFSFIPKYITEDIFGCVLYVFTLFLIARDWYQFHNSEEGMKDENPLVNLSIMILAAIVFYQMLRYSFEPDLFRWFGYWCAFEGLNFVWNLMASVPDKLVIVFMSTLMVIVPLVVGWLSSQVDMPTARFLSVLAFLAYLCLLKLENRYSP